MVFTEITTGSSAVPHPEPDDISLILRQILNRSSSPPLPSSFPSMNPHAGDQSLASETMPISTLHSQFPAPSNLLSGSDRFAVNRIADDTLSGIVLSSSTAYFPLSRGSNWSSDSLTGSVQMAGLGQEYAEEYCDYESESEETPEAAAEEAEMKRPPPRSQSKRSRAAEVHNLSEKRRRSRINEKMKALQNLIPNSNKADKASMLDEAIEYLKQLQLQVQMLSVRNGLSLHPMCLPGVPGILYPAQLSQIGTDLGRRGGSGGMNMKNALNMTTSTSDSMFTIPEQCASPPRATIPSVTTVINSEASSLGLESCILPNFGAFELLDQAVCKEQSLHQDQLFVGNSETKSLVTTSSLLFDTRESDAKGYPLGGHSKQKYGPQKICMENVQ